VVLPLDLEPRFSEGMVKNPVKNTELVVQVSLPVARRKVCRGRKTPLGGGLCVFRCHSLKERTVMQSKDSSAALKYDDGVY
jgi:hypothetical protein